MVLPVSVSYGQTYIYFSSGVVTGPWKSFLDLVPKSKSKLTFRNLNWAMTTRWNIRRLSRVFQPSKFSASVVGQTHRKVQSKSGHIKLLYRVIRACLGDKLLTCLRTPSLWLILEQIVSMWLVQDTFCGTVMFRCLKESAQSRAWWLV